MYQLDQPDYFYVFVFLRFCRYFRKRPRAHAPTTKHDARETASMRPLFASVTEGSLSL